MTNIGDMTSTDLVNKRQAAEMLERTPSTVNKMVKAGHLKPAVVLPGTTRNVASYLFRRRDVERLAAKLRGAA